MGKKWVHLDGKFGWKADARRNSVAQRKAFASIQRNPEKRAERGLSQLD